MNRQQTLSRLTSELWDVAIIGGGATGLGIAVDAVTRGYTVVLLERADFGSGTSSRSTKLIHGGVRYLRQGQIGLVREALHERAILLRNAPHLVQKLPFILPARSGSDRWFYGTGLHLYAALAGRHGLGPTRILNARETQRLLPAANPNGLAGGVLYYDAQFDDARLAVALARTAAHHGAAVLNYMEVEGFNGSALQGRDLESGAEYQIRARIAINAAGPWCDRVRRLAHSGAPPTLTLSQGSHAVVDDSFLGGDTALLVPRTADGRVMFAIPWQGHTLLGTTDTQVQNLPDEPSPRRGEIASILDTAGRYLRKRPREGDVLSVWAGLRPLLKHTGGNSKRTGSIPREHRIFFERPGLLTIEGGKWTSYRRMAEQAVTAAAEYACLPRRPCITRELPIASSINGSVETFVRDEMARTVEDVLARRTRLLFLNAAKAVAEAPAVAAQMAPLLGWSPQQTQSQLERFQQTAKHYLLTGET